ncbi:MAG: hypothetical protein RJB39_2 [Candidatus Parcubacteria bacterium]|jgi:hypothetical protein
MIKLKAKKIFIILSITTIVALGLAGYFFYQLHAAKKDPQAASQKETTELVAKISKLIVLPEGETPTVATVSDPTALKDQVFFAQAQKGDKVLIYAQAKKAILYSLTLNKILEVAPLNIGENKKGKEEQI